MSSSAPEIAPGAGADSGGPGALEIVDLCVSYGAVQALRGISFSVAPGRVTSVLGANGAGKTTLLRAITGLVKPRSGRILLDGTPLTGLPVEEVVRRGVAHVPEGRGVVAELTVEENLRLGGLWRRDKDDRKTALEETYELFPALASRRRQLAQTLSGGERQMLAVGRALGARPRVLLLDEPSLGLAPLITAQLMSLFRHLAQDQGITILLVEQNARSALSIADRAVVLSLGTVVVEDDANRLAGDDALRHHYLGF